VKKQHKIKQRFQDYFMQKMYEDLIKQGLHWKVAQYKTIRACREYDRE